MEIQIFHGHYNKSIKRTKSRSAWLLLFESLGAELCDAFLVAFEVSRFNGVRFCSASIAGLRWSMLTVPCLQSWTTTRVSSWQRVTLCELKNGTGACVSSHRSMCVKSLKLKYSQKPSFLHWPRVGATYTQFGLIWLHIQSNLKKLTYLWLPCRRNTWVFVRRWLGALQQASKTGGAVSR